MNAKSKKPVFIVFEGLDGSGKSEISKRIAGELNAEWMRTPPVKFSKLRGVIDDEYQNNGLAAQLFYASVVVHASKIVKKMLSDGKSIVMDRYVASTLAYDKAVRNSDLSDSFWMEHIFCDLIVPDLTLKLQVSADIRQERMMNGRPDGNRVDDASIKRAKILEKRYKEITSLLCQRSWEITGISNTTAIETCLKKCMKEIMRIQNK